VDGSDTICKTAPCSFVELQIQDLHFILKTLIDTGSDLNMLNKHVIPISLWEKTQATITGLGNVPNIISFQIPEAVLCFKDFCLKLKFLLADIPVACILGTPFLAVVSPHGSTMVTPDKPGYFITLPEGKKVKLPFISTPRISDSMELNILKSEKIKELKCFQATLRIQEKMEKIGFQEKIISLKEEFINNVCSENPTAYWKQRKCEVLLPYKEDYQGKPCKSRAIPMNVEYQKLCVEQIESLLNRDLIRKSTSPWNCYGFYVNKHSEKIRGVPRLVVNYNPLNKVLADDTYPIPNKSSLVTRIARAKIFSKFDLKSGFWQVSIHEKDKFKTAFNVPAGHYEWNVMPFGLKNAPSKFQRIMGDTLKPYFDWLIVYIDDILVFSSSVEQHFKHLKKILQIIKQAGLVLSKKKIELFQLQVKFLGHTINNGQITL